MHLKHSFRGTESAARESAEPAVPSSSAPRGRLGTMVAMPQFDAESYLDFVEGLRRFTVRSINPVAAAALRERVPPTSTDLTELRAAGARIPVVGLRNRLLRSTQDLNWATVVAQYERIRPQLEAELDAAQDSGPGRLELAAEWTHPDYSRNVHFHRQPGGYQDDSLAGYIYHYGTKVFHLGTNDYDEAKIARAWEVPEPADGHVERVADIACSIGAMTVAFKHRWPQAEVWGIDSAAPLLRYAHARAVGLASDVIFSQQLAEDMHLADGSVDVAYLGTLLHEVPYDVAVCAVSEARRVLRPGGVLVVHEMRQADDPPDPWAEYDRDFDTRFNGEPYAYDFVHADIGEVLNEHFDSLTFSVDRTSRWVAVA